ncbi:excinuclease ABC subunit UvrC [Candidatus Uhrbacteria bacterium]|jgi:excinuclease ABC subunit C|nr:excinuclease ABC subunit UvrC [Candidatus Uhrbacteria bacterium]
MAISAHVIIKNGKLPDGPGVYFYYDEAGKLLYVGKATSLKRRVSSYWQKKYKKDDSYGKKITKMVSEIVRIDYEETGSAIEALVLEANMVRRLKPHYNALLVDDKSFLYLVFTNDEFPKPIFKRGLELSRQGIDPFSIKLDAKAKKRYLVVFGPFTSPRALRNALDLLRFIFPWSTCEPPSVTGKTRPCFDAHIKRCPGVCTGAINKQDYRRNVRAIIQFFQGKRGSIVKKLKSDMKKAALKLEFEKAGKMKSQIRSLEHIRDISVITKDFSPMPYENPDKDYVDALGRVEAYDISNISGKQAVGSMVVFEHGRPVKAKYRKFKIKTVEGPNDVAMMKEVMTRRLKRAESYPKAWELPDVMVIDGGKPQVNAVQAILDDMQIRVPIVGLAKGPDRKQDVLIYDHADVYLSRIVHAQKPLFQKARDEAHRFAVAYHRKLREMRDGLSRKKKKR